MKIKMKILETGKETIFDFSPKRTNWEYMFNNNSCYFNFSYNCSKRVNKLRR